ncbi:hypothetical protein CBS101457_004784 [Exobasidium rhododendri]|nr:hypothetical protein CBS101457_004784 [Exobasidium rhododendri]
MRFSSTSRAVAASAFLAVLTSVAEAQTSAGCVSLQGSTQCPSFQDAYVNPTNLTGSWPWFSAVTNVTTFDQQFALYFTDPTRFTATKFNTQLQCNRAAVDNTTLQWERTILCGQFSQISYSAQCNIANQANPIMVCQDTCVQYSDSENSIVGNEQICTADAQLSAANLAIRNATLTKDYTTCTDWTSLVSTTNSTCVEGVTNEGNCGYGPNVSSQLCAACDPTGNNPISSCCYDSKTDLTQCASFGHEGAVSVRATSSAAPGFASSTGSASSSSTGAAGTSAAGNRSASGSGLSHGALAGIIIGSIVGAILLGLLLVLLLLAAKRRRNKDNEQSRGLIYGGAARRSSTGDKAWNQSEEGTTRSIDASPLREKDHSPISAAGTGLGGVGAGAGLGAGAIAGGGAAAAVAAGGASKSSSPQNRPDSQLSSGTGGSDGRGTTVPMVRDQYTGQEIHPGEEVIAIYPYNASLNDELTLEPDQRVTIVRLYDDGWALGKTSNGQEGAIPLVCVSSAKGDIPGRAGAGTATATGTSEDDGMTSGAEYTSSVDGAVTAEEAGFTSDATGYRSARSNQR